MHIFLRINPPITHLRIDVSFTQNTVSKLRICDIGMTIGALVYAPIRSKKTSTKLLSDWLSDMSNQRAFYFVHDVPVPEVVIFALESTDNLSIWGTTDFF